MAQPQRDRARDLAAQFAESKRAYDAAVIAGAELRRAIVTELLTLMDRAEVAHLLHITPQRVSGIVSGRSRGDASSLTHARHGH